MQIFLLKSYHHNFSFTLGQSNNNSDTCAEFRIKYVGAIEKLKLSEGKCLEGPLDLINYIDVAQVKKKKKKGKPFCLCLYSFTSVTP